MRWPWITQDTLVVLIGTFSDQLTERDTAWQARYDALLEKYHALKVQGGAIPQAAPTLERKEVDLVMAAITAKAGPDRRLRALMSREAMQQRAQGVDDVDIIRQIEQGVTADEDGIPA